MITLPHNMNLIRITINDTERLKLNGHLRRLCVSGYGTGSVYLILKSPVGYKKRGVQFCTLIPGILCSLCHIGETVRVVLVSEDTTEEVDLFGHLRSVGVHTTDAL